MENNEQLDTINPCGLRNRIKRELELLQKNGYLFHILSINHECYNKLYNINTYIITIQNNIDNKIYEFTLPIDYPFRPPKLKINDCLYLNHQKLSSQYFIDALIEYKGIKCFCCESILCSNNWSPGLTFKNIFEEIIKFRDYCREISHRVIINVIKRKYLIDDIKIVDWLY